MAWTDPYLHTKWHVRDFITVQKILDLDVIVRVIFLWRFADYQDNTRLNETDEVGSVNLTFVRYTSISVLDRLLLCVFIHIISSSTKFNVIFQ